MKLTIERAALLKALGHVQSVVERRNTVPILSNVLLSAEREYVGFSATDLDMEIVDETPANVEGTGQITAPAHTLYEIVRKLPEGAQVELSAANTNQLTLSSGRSHFKLGCLPVEDFPKMPEGDLKHKFTLSASDLRVLVKRARRLVLIRMMSGNRKVRGKEGPTARARIDPLQHSTDRGRLVDAEARVAVAADLAGVLEAREAAA